MPEKKCACGTSMDNVHDVWLCPHCDAECTSKPCTLCGKYSAQTQIRINTAAREDRPEPPPPTGPPAAP